MAEVQRRATGGGDLGARERRKSGIFFFNRSFKNSRSSTFTKGEADSPVSSPTTPTLGPTKDFELKRTASGHSITALAQTSMNNAEGEGVLSSSPKSASASLGEATPKPADSTSLHTKSPEAIASEDLPTPPQTPGHSSVEAVTNAEAGEHEEAAPLSTETEVEQAQPTKASYHDDADLDIRVQEADGVDAIYSVRACILESASPVWKQSLLSEPSTTTLDLTSDPAPGLDVIFSIAHYKFQALPQQVSEDQFHSIALVAEKYQTLHLLPPFVKGWLASLAAPTGDADKLLATGWILGQIEWFAQAIAQCANAASVSAADGVTLLDAAGRPWHEQPVSAAVVDLLAATRAAAVERIIRAVSTPMNRLLNPERYPDEADLRCCHSAEDDAAVREECEQLQLGSAIMGLTKARLWPAPEPSRIRASPLELARAYRDVRVRRYQTPGLRFQEEGSKDVHAQCGLGHLAEIETILGEPAVLSTAMVQDLQARAKQSGIYSDALFAGFESVLADEPAAPAPAPVVEEETAVVEETA